MSAEITPAAVVLLALLAALLLHDYTSNKRRARDLWLQAIVFIVGGGLIVYPEIARRLAHSVGIGRGVDFVLYPLVIWLVRESLLSRRRRHEDEEKITELVRSLAILRAQKLNSPADASPPAR
jgi:small membrane protein